MGEPAQEYTDIVQGLCAENHLRTLAEFDAKNSEALNEMVSKHGVKVMSYPDDVIITFQKLTKETLDDMAAQNPKINEVYQNYLTFQKKVAPWSEMTNRAYMRAKSL